MGEHGLKQKRPLMRSPLTPFDLDFTAAKFRTVAACPVYVMYAEVPKFTLELKADPSWTRTSRQALASLELFALTLFNWDLQQFGTAYSGLGFGACFWDSVSPFDLPIEARLSKKFLKKVSKPFTFQIELDLLRTLPNNKHYDSPNADGIPKLRRVLLAYSVHNPDVEYCQVSYQIGFFQN